MAYTASIFKTVSTPHGARNTPHTLSTHTTLTEARAACVAHAETQPGFVAVLSNEVEDGGADIAAAVAGDILLYTVEPPRVAAVMTHGAAILHAQARANEVGHRVYLVAAGMFGDQRAFEISDTYDESRGFIASFVDPAARFKKD